MVQRTCIGNLPELLNLIKIELPIQHLIFLAFQCYISLQIPGKVRIQFIGEKSSSFSILQPLD